MKKDLKDVQEKEYMIYSYYPKTQFQANISVFGCAVTEKNRYMG